MNRQRTHNLQGFTLVELIVVITILAILGTIAFLSLQGYSKSARDSKRISDISNIETSLSLFSLATGKYPQPDNAQDVTYSGGTVVVWKQGTVGENVRINLGRNLSEIPLDPLYGIEYTYSTLENRSEYELMSVYEGDTASLNGILDTTYAATNVIVKVDGTYNGLFVKLENYIIPTPSIITALSPIGLDFDSEAIKSQVIDRGENIPDLGVAKIEVSTGALSNLVLSVYNGNIVKNSTNIEKISAVIAIKEAYQLSSLSNVGVYKDILEEVSHAELISFVDTQVVQTSQKISTENLQWRDQDSSCDQDDVVIGTQVWAGCNSTLGTGFEFGQTDANIGTNNYNGTLLTCYPNYDGVDSVGGCILGDTTMNSGTNANTWFTGTTANGDTEVNNIWGKFYTADNAGGACGIGYHLPSIEEFEYTQEYLFEAGGGSPDCRNVSEGEACEGLGWELHNTRAPFNSLVQALKIPLSGYRAPNGNDFGRRGYNSWLWATTTDPADFPATAISRGLQFEWNISGSWRGFRSEDYGFNIRCIKD